MGSQQTGWVHPSAPTPQPPLPCPSHTHTPGLCRLRLRKQGGIYDSRPPGSTASSYTVLSPCFQAPVPFQVAWRVSKGSALLSVSPHWLNFLSDTGVSSEPLDHELVPCTTSRKTAGIHKNFLILDSPWSICLLLDPSHLVLWLLRPTPSTAYGNPLEASFSILWNYLSSLSKTTSRMTSPALLRSFWLFRVQQVVKECCPWKNYGALISEDKVNLWTNRSNDCVTTCSLLLTFLSLFFMGSVDFFSLQPPIFERKR